MGTDRVYFKKYIYVKDKSRNKSKPPFYLHLRHSTMPSDRYAKEMEIDAKTFIFDTCHFCCCDFSGARTAKETDKSVTTILYTSDNSS